MAQDIGRIAIVGGGTAGWLSACYLAARKAGFGREPSITLIESPDIPTIGVGEGTWPTMRDSLATIGIDEAEFLHACDASFKQGSRFDGWVDGTVDDSYLHPFTPPPAMPPRDLVFAWKASSQGVPFAGVMTSQAAVCAASLAPRQAMMAPYAGALNYAYHLDAAKLAALLMRHAVQRLGVQHLADEVVDVEREGDRILAVHTKSGRRVEAELFIDCSGHRALLIGQQLGGGWVDASHMLFNDRALAAQVPVDPGSPIASQTIGTAHRAGWLWDIALPTRRGIGCVYSSRYMADEEAEGVLRDYVRERLGDDRAGALVPRRLIFPTGHRERFWVGNCLAIGLSAGFVEPLEASAIVMIELSLRALADNFPANVESLPIHARRFDALFRTRWERIIDFLKLHYALGTRSEPYWEMHRQPDSRSERLSDLLALWRDQPPSDYDFPMLEELFTAASYQYVLYGMAGRPPGGAVRPCDPAPFDVIRNRTRSLLAALPTNRDYIDALRAQVIQPDRSVH
jgi:glycine/D-amino acid oxidase-like deaminating enzyme